MQLEETARSDNANFGGVSTYSGRAAVSANATATAELASLDVAFDLGLSVDETPAFRTTEWREGSVAAGVQINVWVIDDPNTDDDGVHIKGSLTTSQVGDFSRFRYFLGHNPRFEFLAPNFEYGAYFNWSHPTVDLKVNFGRDNPTRWTSEAGVLYRHVGIFNVSGSVNDWGANMGNRGFEYSAGAFGDFKMAFERTGISAPPVAQIDGPTEVVLGSTETLTSTSYDPDDGTAANQGIVSWAWRDITDPANPIDLGTEPTAVMTGVAIGDRKIELVVTDNEGQPSDPTIAVLRCGKPNLVPSGLWYQTNQAGVPRNGPLPVNKGFGVTFTIANDASIRAPSSRYTLVISSDGIIGNGDDLAIAEGELPAIGSGSHHVVEVSNLRLPGTADSDGGLTSPYPHLQRFGGVGRFFGVIVDAESQLPEAAEGDNTARTRVQLYDPVYPYLPAAGRDFNSAADAEAWLDEQGFSGYRAPLDAGRSRDWGTPRFSYFTGRMMPTDFFRVQAGVVETTDGRWRIVTQGPEPSPRFFYVPGNVYRYGQATFNYVRTYHQLF